MTSQTPLLAAIVAQFLLALVASRVIAAEEEITYDPKSLEVIDQGDSGWLLTDGRIALFTLDNEVDAKQALALSRRHTHLRIIGRDNKRPNRFDYMVHYWKGDSGIKTELAIEQCIVYDSRKLRIVTIGLMGWLLKAGDTPMFMLDNETDANRVLAIAKQHTRLCFIGKGNKRPVPMQHIVMYWE